MTQKQRAVKFVKQNEGTQAARVLSVLLNGKPITAFKGILTARVSSWHRRLADLRSEGFSIPHGIRGKKQTYYVFPAKRTSEKKIYEKVLSFEKNNYC